MIFLDRLVINRNPRVIDDRVDYAERVRLRGPAEVVDRACPVALTGGVGSVLGVVATGIILIMLNPILSAMGIDANTAQVIQGALIAGVMMIGGLVTLYRERSS